MVVKKEAYFHRGNALDLLIKLEKLIQISNLFQCR